MSTAAYDRMLDTYLAPERTVSTAKGDGPVVDIRSAESHLFLLLLDITGAVEQESLDVSIFGGSSEGGIGNVPLASFPQQFYTGALPLLLDLTALPLTTVLRAHWEVNRWGRGQEKPWFEFGLKLTEVPPETLAELRQQSCTRGPQHV